MRLIIQRFIAILLLVLPGLLATYGFLVIKDVIFIYFAMLGNEAAADHSFQIGKLIWGILCFLAGTGFIGGWIYFRDQKRNYVVPRFKKRR